MTNLEIISKIEVMKARGEVPPLSLLKKLNQIDHEKRLEMKRKNRLRQTKNKP
jgi:hypothetical protein